MKYLLIDFGASYIKTVLFDQTTDTFSNQKSYDSPFLYKTSITKKELQHILNLVVIDNPCDAISICTILGGHYEDDTYYSWKSDRPKMKNYCLVSGLFNDQPTFHIHTHHKEFTNNDSYETGLRVLGYILDIPLYSSLGDTYSVIHSIDINDTDVGINLGTGSQVFYKQNGELKVHMYIPSGRAFLLFQRFFQEFEFDMFSYMSTLSDTDVISSTLDVDLNVFSSADKFERGGSISSIVEGTFTKHNLISSILREYVLQYKSYIPSNTRNIYLLGGIVNKVKCLADIFKHYYPTHNIILRNPNVESTHLGIAKFIKSHNPLSNV